MNKMFNGYLIAAGSSHKQEAKGHRITFIHRFYDPDQTMNVQIDVFDKALFCEVNGLPVQARVYFENQLLGNNKSSFAFRHQSDRKIAVEAFSLITQNIKLMGINPNNVMWQLTA